MSAQYPYTPQIGKEVARYYAAGHTFADIADLGPWAPTAAVIQSWKQDYPEFKKMIEEVETAHAESLADQCIEIADDPTIHYKIASMRIKARQWKAGKLDRAKYGEKVEVRHSLTLDMGALLAEAEQRLVTSATVYDITPSAHASLEEVDILS